MFRSIGTITGYFVSEPKARHQVNRLTGMDFIPLEEMLTVLPAR